MELNIELLSEYFINEKELRGLPLRDISVEIGVSTPTLSRLQNNGIPDVNTFIRVCDWLNVSMDKFIKH